MRVTTASGTSPAPLQFFMHCSIHAAGISLMCLTFVASKVGDLFNCSASSSAFFAPRWIGVWVISDSGLAASTSMCA
eukprot:416349-Pyramimonas_sp.AAC.1